MSFELRCAGTFYLQYVTAPMFDSLSPLMQKVCYIIVMPGNIISGCAASQICGKQLYIKIVRQKASLQAHWSGTWAVWVGINLATWTAAWILAECV